MDALTPDALAALARNVAHVRGRIAAACARAARDPAAVGLVAVTKYTGPALAQALVDLGQVDLGENRTDHLLELEAALRGAAPAAGAAAARPRWHMVGHLQRNKARAVAGVLDVLHSLDSLDLARALERARPPARPPLDVYVEVRLAGAPERSGIEPGELPSFLAGLAGLTRLRVLGLMGMPPAGADARPFFRLLRELSASARDAGLAPGLSMGMSSDLEVAVEEGASVVRVGQALLDGVL